MKNVKKSSLLILFSLFLPIILMFLPLRFLTVNATTTNYKFVKEGTLTVATNTPFPPWEYRDGNDFIGVDMDISRRIAEVLGLKLEIHDVAYDALVLELINKKCDFIIAGMSATPENKKSIDFSIPYASSKQLIIVNIDSDINKKEDICDKRLGAQLSSTGYNYCLDNKYNVSPFEPIDAILALKNKQLDAVIMDELPARDMVNKNKKYIKILDDYLFEEEYRIGFSKGNVELENIINKVLEDLINSHFISEKIQLHSLQNDRGSGFIQDIKSNLIEKDRSKQILNGLIVTFKITLSALIIGIILGYITAFTILSKSKNFFVKILRFLAKSYVNVIRGTPVVCQLFIMYYIIIGPFGVDNIISAILAFGINSGAYVSEIIRSGILSVDSGQIEAGKALGLNDSQIMSGIIAPQALKNSLAALCNEFIQLLKETSVAGFIGVMDLNKVGETIRAQTLSPAIPLISVALIYFIIVCLVGVLVSFLERRLREGDNN